MLLAWAVTEVIRYSYFVANLRVDSSGAEGQEVPRWLVWLRYNTFYVLYPVGIGSEMTCVWLASQAAGTRAVRLLLWDVLVVYVPGECWLRRGRGRGRGCADCGCSGVCDVYAYDEAEEEGHEGEAAGEEEGELSGGSPLVDVGDAEGSTVYWANTGSWKLALCSSIVVREASYRRRIAPGGVESRRTLPPLQLVLPISNLRLASWKSGLKKALISHLYTQHSISTRNHISPHTTMHQHSTQTWPPSHSLHAQRSGH